MVASPISAGTMAVKARSGVSSRRAAPVMLPATATTTRPTKERSHRGRRPRSASPAAKFPGVVATVFDAFAMMGGSPTASRAGNVMRDEPPTMAVTTPPARPAAKSSSAAGASTSVR